MTQIAQVRDIYISIYIPGIYRSIYLYIYLSIYLSIYGPHQKDFDRHEMESIVYLPDA